MCTKRLQAIEVRNQLSNFLTYLTYYHSTGSFLLAKRAMDLWGFLFRDVVLGGRYKIYIRIQNLES